MILTARYSIDQYPDGSDGLSSGLREALKAAVKGLERLPPEDLLSRSPAIAQCNRAYGRIREPERGRRRGSVAICGSGFEHRWSTGSVSRPGP